MESIIFLMIASILVMLICSVLFFEYINTNVLLSLKVIAMSALILGGFQVLTLSAQLNYGYEGIGFGIFGIILYFIIFIISTFSMIYEYNVIKLKMIMSKIRILSMKDFS